MALRGFGDLGRMAIYLQRAGSTGNYLRELGSKLRILGILGALPKSKKKNKEKPPSILFDFLKNSAASGGLAP